MENAKPLHLPSSPFTKSFLLCYFSTFTRQIAHNFGRTRGHTLKLQKNRSWLDLRLNFFLVRVVTLWSCLDDQCVTATSLNSFKTNTNHIPSANSKLNKTDDKPSSGRGLSLG